MVCATLSSGLKKLLFNASSMGVWLLAGQPIQPTRGHQIESGPLLWPMDKSLFVIPFVNVFIMDSSLAVGRYEVV